MARQIGSKVSLNSDRANSRASTAVRDAKCLVQIQVTHVRSEVRWTAEPHQSVHICAIHINLSAVLMDDFTNLRDSLFKYAVG